MKTNQPRDKRITREIRRLFWRGNWQSKGTLVITYLGRIPAIAAYNVFIPLVSAFGIQAILTHHFNDVTRYAVWVVILSLVYTIFWGTAGIAVSRNGTEGAKYVQNQAFAKLTDAQLAEEPLMTAPAEK